MRTTVLLAVIVAAGALVHSQGPAAGLGVPVMSSASALAGGESNAAALAELRGWDRRVTDMSQSDEIRRIAAENDTAVAGRMHERFEQRHRGVRVFGGELTRQVNRFGQAESIFGRLYPDVTIDVTAAIDAAAAGRQLVAAGGGAIVGASAPELVILPAAGDTYRLTYTARVFSAGDGWLRRVFIDADTGVTVDSYIDTWTQTPAVGTGPGIVGETKKMMTGRQGGTYLAADMLRPPPSQTLGSFPLTGILTFDFKGSLSRALTVLNSGSPGLSDIASDDDNAWTDAGIVDAHTYAGYTYDFLYKRFGRRGLDNANIQLRLFTNPVKASDYTTLLGSYSSFFLNAGYFGGGNMYFGVGLPPGVTYAGHQWYPFAGALDVVAHELTHGVTQYTSNLIYRNESGALNEAFSDMMGASAEFMFQPVGSGLGQADWTLGEDIERPGGTRSLAAPSTYGHPDHYSIRYTGTGDGGGVHINSSIVNHMFYLAIVGGTHRVSKQAVTGVGFANRAQVESVIFRAFTALLPANATFAMARAATIQAARDLYGTNSPTERALAEAWSAVGVS